MTRICTTICARALPLIIDLDGTESEPQWDWERVPNLWWSLSSFYMCLRVDCPFSVAMNGSCSFLLCWLMMYAGWINSMLFQCWFYFYVRLWWSFVRSIFSFIPLRMKIDEKRNLIWDCIVSIFLALSSFPCLSLSNRQSQSIWIFHMKTVIGVKQKYHLPHHSFYLS